MGVEDATVLEHEQLMLAASFHGSHARASQRSCVAWGEAAAQRRVQHLDGLDFFSRRCLPDAPHGALDFWKFWHRSLCGR